MYNNIHNRTICDTSPKLRTTQMLISRILHSNENTQMYTNVYNNNDEFHKHNMK